MTTMRVLEKDELGMAAGGDVLGAIPGVSDQVNLPSGLFVHGYYSSCFPGMGCSFTNLG